MRSHRGEPAGGRVSPAPLHCQRPAPARARDRTGRETTVESLSADSIDLIELVTALEEDFDTAIDDDRLTSIKSIGDAVDLLSQNL